MSRETVEIVQRLCEAFLAGDVETALDGLSAEVEWHGTVGGLGEGSIARGHAEVIAAFAESLADWERHTLEVEALIDAGDQVVVFWHEVGRGRASGAEVETRTGVIYRVADGKISEVHPYMNRDEALAAAGAGQS